MLDLIVKNGTIYDGSGGKSFRANIGIKDDKIVCLTTDKNIEAKEIYDANCLCVTPGFVDIHTHTDYSVFVDNRQESQIRQGVTTEVGGLCGGSVAPCSDKTRKKVSGFLTPQLNYNWHSMKDFFDCLKQHTISTNISMMVGHGTIRHLAMQDTNPTMPATSKDIANMVSILEECLQEGAVGMSSGLEYYPGKAATTAELEILCRVLQKYDGFHAPHVRNRDVYSLLGFTEVIEISRKTGCCLQISHLNPKYGRDSKTVARTLQLIKWLEDDGVEVGIDIMPTEWNFVNAPSLMPSWFHEKTLEDKLSLLNSEEGRKRLKDNDMPMWQLAVEDKWDKIRLFTSTQFIEYHGLTLEEIGQKWKMNGFDALCKILWTEKEQMEGVVITGYAFSITDIIELLSYHNCSVGSDAISSAIDGPLKNVCIGTNSYLWSHIFIKEYIQEKGVLTFEEGIRRITSLPAKQARIQNRGLIKIGNYADLVILDKNMPKNSFEISKPKKYPDNIKTVFVNGKCVLHSGERTNERPGMVIFRNQ